eukprot:scaffold96148_cov32-Tisochrysis_lutea.AAC.4
MLVLWRADSSTLGHANGSEDAVPGGDFSKVRDRGAAAFDDFGRDPSEGTCTTVSGLPVSRSSSRRSGRPIVADAPMTYPREKVISAAPEQAGLALCARSVRTALLRVVMFGTGQKAFDSMRPDAWEGPTLFC